VGWEFAVDWLSADCNSNSNKIDEKIDKSYINITTHIYK
jgi:hypothetical protein